MSVADVLRWLVILLSCFCLGTMLALYERVGRFILPKTTIRLLVAATSLFVVSLMVEVGARFGEPVHVRTILDLLAVLFYLLALMRLYIWFGSEEGRRARHQIINQFAASELHALAELARAMEEDPDHIGRYVEPGWWGSVGRWWHRWRERIFGSIRTH